MDEKMSEGQVEEINRIYAIYLHLNDDLFIKEHIEEWKKNI